MWAWFDEIERLAGAAKTLLAGRVDECEVWRREGHRTAADYMAAVAGCSVTGARRTLATSKRLGVLPATEAVLRSGGLSAAQVERIADAASVNPGAEAGLLGLAGTASLRELDDACGRAKVAGDPDPEATYRRVHRNRRLYQSRDAEGAWCLFGRGPVDSGALFTAALEPIIDELFARARAEGRQETRERLAFDALVELTRRARDDDRHLDDLDTDTEAAGVQAPDATSAERAVTDHAGTAGATGPDRAQRRRAKRKLRRSRDQKWLGLLRIDLEALQRGRVEGQELCEISGIGPVPVSRARELLGDAVIKLVITKSVDVASVTHLGRGPTVAQRMGLLWQMPCCSVEGCSRTWVQNDHRIDWATTRHTRLDELDPLCHHHHSLKTRHGWALVAGKGNEPWSHLTTHATPPTTPPTPATPPTTTPTAARQTAGTPWLL